MSLTAHDPMLKKSKITDIRGSFNVHTNYVNCVEQNFEGLSISCKLHQNNSHKLDRTVVDRFLKLSAATHKSLEQEIAIISDNGDYARVAVAWIPVKSYYVIYYLEAVMMYLIDTQDRYFGNGGHLATINGMKAQINSKKLMFSNSKISEMHTIGELYRHTILSGANQKPSFYQTDECILSIQKTLSKYPENGFKRSIQAHNGYRTKHSQLARDKFYATKGMNLTEFFYWMRIKVNYRDADYLDPIDNTEITDEEIILYANTYYRAYDWYRVALDALIKDLLAQRSM